MKQKRKHIPAVFLYTAAVIFAFFPLVRVYPETSAGVTIGFTGDIMVHNSQLKRSWLGLDSRGNDLGYNFSPMFEWFSEYLKKPDLMIGNLETTFGGPDSAWIKDEKYAFREYQAYPTFTTPDELAEALAEAGFDLLGTANNHCMDSNLEGAARTVEILKNAGLESTGTSAEGKPDPWEKEINGIKIKVFSWTASVNGLVSSRGMQTINVFNAKGKDGRLQEMLKEIRDAKKDNPDILILLIHWGQEYFDEPDQYQKNLAELALKNGADIIIGSHPHVLQPFEIRDSNFIAWSMGNFISSQRFSEGRRAWVDGSVMLELTISKDKYNKVSVSGIDFIPLYVKWSSSAIRVLPINEGLKEDGTRKFNLTEYDRQRIKILNEHIADQITLYMKDTAAVKTDTGWSILNPDINFN